MSGEDLQPGSLVADQYEIERLIGSGGFARVYRARQLELDRPVALKVLAPRSENDSDSNPETVKKRFWREARLISQLQAPHTVTVYEYDVLDDGKLYMALEYIDGTDLDHLISQEAPLAPDRITRILSQVLKALGAAHNQDVLHRDIKPTNVMVFEQFGESDCVKLLDFGIAKSVMAENKLESGLTMEGAVIGTPRYMSPEQLLGRPLTPASDLFSAGLLVYEMYTGESPFETHDVNAIHRRMQEMPDDLGPLEEAPSPLVDVARKLLTPEIEDRYGDAGEVLEDLRGRPRPEQTGPPEVLEDVAGGEPTPEPDEPPRAAADESDAISFPLGLDRAGGTPSTELTSVSAGGQTTIAMTPSSAPGPATPEVEVSTGGESAPSASPSPVRESAPAEPPGPPSTEPPDDDRPRGDETAVTADRDADPPVQETRSRKTHTTPKMPDDPPSPEAAIGGLSWRALGLGTFVVLGLAAGIWFALASGGDDTSPPPDETRPERVDERLSDRGAPAETPSPAAADIESAHDRAADRLGGAVDEARNRAETAADESSPETSPSSEDSREPDRPQRDQRPAREPAREPAHEPARDRSAPSEGATDDSHQPSTQPDRTRDESTGSTDETSDESQDPGFEVEPLK